MGFKSSVKGGGEIGGDCIQPVGSGFMPKRVIENNAVGVQGGANHAEARRGHHKEVGCDKRPKSVDGRFIDA